jgi:ribosomal protein S27E
LGIIGWDFRILTGKRGRVRRDCGGNKCRKEEAMALIKCKECGKEVSDSARRCPNCGKYLWTSTRIGCLIFLLFFVIVFIYGIYQVSK